jgi:1-phosphofructokinase
LIVTLTLNPSLDRTLELETLVRGGVLRTADPILEPGGKGVNVTRALAANGVASIAVLPVGGGEGNELRTLLETAGVRAHFVPVAGRTRSNITIAESDGTVTKLNEPGAALTTDDLSTLIRVLRTIVSAGDWVVMSGSVPPQFTGEQIAEIAQSLSTLDVNLAVDTSGDALVASLAARPRLIKPNRDELCEIVGRPVSSIAEVIDAAQEVRALGIENVLVSLGSDGAVLVTPDVTLIGESVVAKPRSTVGAGDSFLAGFLSKFTRNESDVRSAFLEALAWGAASTSLPGSAVPAPTDIDYTNVQLVWQPDLDRPLLAG